MTGSRWQKTGFLAAALALAFLIGAAGLALAQGSDQESNNTCATAQDIGSIQIPYTLFGELETQNDIDFFRFSGPANQVLAVDLEGSLTGQGTLHDPMLALYNSSCERLTFSDDSGVDINAALEFTVPPDGVFILAATSYGDYDFTGNGSGSGTYRLKVDEFLPIGAIQGRVVDAFNGALLSGNSFPNVRVTLQRCGEENRCEDIYTNLPINSDGTFQFTTGPDNQPLMKGVYKLSFQADQYQPRETGEFGVGNGETKDFGDFTLTPFSVQFLDVEQCQVPAGEEECSFSFTAVNRTPQRYDGAVWIIVSGSNLGTVANSTEFQAGEPKRVRLDGDASRRVRFTFHVPGFVPDGAILCADAYYGQDRRSPYFTTIGAGRLFCSEKGVIYYPGTSAAAEQAAPSGKSK